MAEYEPGTWRVRIGQFLFRYRGWLPLPFFALAWVAPCPTGISWGLAGVLLILGEFLRVLSVAHAGRTTRARHITAPRLALSGPYAWVRHPIYLGNFLVGWAFVAWLTADLRIWVAYALLFWMEYFLITEAEEAYLLRHFEEYRVYRKRVPRFLPLRGRAWPATDPGDIRMALHSERSTFWLIVGVGVAGGVKVLLGCSLPW